MKQSTQALTVERVEPLLHVLRGERIILDVDFADETAIVEVLQRVMEILDPPPQPEPKRRQIGLHAADDKEKE